MCTYFRACSEVHAFTQVDHKDTELYFKVCAVRLSKDRLGIRLGRGMSTYTYFKTYLKTDSSIPDKTLT